MTTKQADPSLIQQLEVDSVLRRFKSKFESLDEKKEYEHRKLISEVKNRFDELKHSDLEHSTVEAYNRYMQINGIMKRPIIKAPVNPIKQR